MKICVFLPNWVGDIVMSTPTLRALRRRYPDAHIVGVLRTHLREVLEGTSWINEYCYYERGRDGKRDYEEVYRLLEQGKFDMALFLINNFATAAMAKRAGVKKRVGSGRKRSSRFLTQTLSTSQKNRDDMPVSTLDCNLELAYAAGCQREEPGLELATTAIDDAHAETVWQKLDLGPRVAVLNSSGAYGSAKLWPDRYFVELARQIVAKCDYQVLFLCGPDERERIARLTAAAADPNIVSLADEEPSIGLSKACVRKAAFLVTTDSGPRHFGVAFGLPVVTLFGPTHIALTDLHYDKELCLQVPVDCGPCQQRECPMGHHKCMNELTVDMVLNAVYGILSNQQNVVGPDGLTNTR